MKTPPKPLPTIKAILDDAQCGEGFIKICTYKSFDLKQSFKEGRAGRTEGTMNNPLDFGVGKDLKNLPHLKPIARNIHHRWLEVQRASPDCRFSQQSLQRLPEPTVTPDGQKAPDLKFAQPRVMALLMALCWFLTRYELTPYGRHTSLFLVRLYQRVLRPGLAAALEPPWKVDVLHPLRDKIQELDAVLERMLRDAHLQN